MQVFPFKRMPFNFITLSLHRKSTLTAPPWEWEITSALHRGDNDISVTVYNALGNYYETIPTRYRSGTRSGIIGRAMLLLEENH